MMTIQPTFDHATGWPAPCPSQGRSPRLLGRRAAVSEKAARAVHAGATDAVADPGFCDGSSSPEAAAAFARAVHAVAAHRPEAAGALAETLAADPDHVGAHALTGFARLMLARSELAVPTAEALGDARAALARRGGGTADERVMVEALAIAVAGNLLAAADRLDQGAAHKPAALLSFKLSHGLRFMRGDRAGMLRRGAAALDDLDGGRATGFVLGCHAFALEEHGRYDAAETVGRRAVEFTPEDSWGRHAVAHVHEMRGETAEGIAWIEDARRHWSGCNNFSFHMAWHLALLHLERGDNARALDLYDREVRPTQTDDFRDMANAVSLLWRLGQLGVSVGDRWQALAEVARHRQTDATLVFAALHTLTALVAIGDQAAAARLTGALEIRARGSDEQGRIARRVGVPLARLLAGLATPRERRGLDRLLRDLPKLGGSNAQRDVFLLALARIAGEAGDTPATARIGRLRGQLKAEDRLLRSIATRAAQ